MHISKISTDEAEIKIKLLTLKLKACKFKLKDAEQEEMSMLSVQLATKFLFQVGFRTKKTLRGPAIDWYVLIIYKRMIKII